MDCMRQLQLQQVEELDQKHCCEFDKSDDDDEDDESYIEIVLDNGNGRSLSMEDGDGEDEDEDEEEYELRISISSTIPIPLVEDQQNLHYLHNHNHSMEMEMEPTLAEPDSLPIPLHPTHDHHQHSSLKFPLVNRLFTTVSLFNLRLLWENRQTATQTPKTIHNDTYDNAKTRKEPSTTTKTTTANGRGSMNIMMKLLIKFPTSKIRKLLTSFLKPNTKSCEKSKTIIQCYCYDKRRMVKNPRDSGHGGTAHSFRSSSKVLEIDLGAIRGMLSAVGLPSISKRTSWSTSSSCGPSPLHHTYPDDSIQSAVAYCKTSLQQTSQI